MWPSKFTDYGVSASSRWAATRKAQGKSIDILREFADAANKWGVKICYYINPLTDGFLSKWKQNVTAQVFMEKQKGMLTEVLTNYGPVNRLWFDGPGGSPRPAGLESAAEYKAYYDECFALIRKVSPATLTSAQRGDVCASTGSLYTNSGPAPNSTNSSECDPPSEQGEYFHPNELHGVTMQEGPDGNTAAAPTYWFWHPWVCAFNVTGCPWVGHANASRIFDGYVATVGHGGVLNMNIAPDETGLLNESVVAVMKEVGQALNDTFRLLDAVGLRGKVGNVSGPCGMGVVVLNVSDSKGDGFDYIRTMEDMRYGQRIGNYSIEYRVKGSVDWQLLVPPVHVNKTSIGQSHKGKSSLGMQDRPDGHDPRDQYVGHKRIDVPLASVPTSGSGSIRIAQVRFNCLRLIPDYNPNDESDAAPGAAGDVHVREFSLHRKVVPWEK
jgi:alpha-L-fucosidase